MQLEDMFDYKNQLMHDLLTTPSIVRLLDDNINVEDAQSLAYDRVFPLEYVPDTAQEGKTYICFDVDITKSFNKTYYEPTLYIWVFAHRSKMRLPDGGGIRCDRICSEIAKKINGSRYYGLGQLDLYSTKRFAPMTDYVGRYMTFHMTEFNRTYDPNQSIPSNRKRG